MRACRGRREDDMTFEVKTRNAKGGIEYIRIEAESRSALFAELKNRGVSAISVETVDGKAKPRKVAKATGVGGGKPVSGAVKGVVALVAVCVIGAVVWLCGSKEDSSVGEQNPVKDTAESWRVRGMDGTDKNGHDESMSEKSADIRSTEPLGSVESSLSDIPVSLDMPNPSPSRPTIFENSSDQLLSMAVNSGDGDMPPMPLGGNLDAEFKKSLSVPIVINDTDDPKVKEVKRRVIEAREEMKALMADGMSVKEVLEEMQKQANFNADTRRRVYAEARSIFDSGDVDGARMFVTRMNAALGEMGIKEIEMPMTREERRERIQQRILERQAQREVN